MKKQFIIEIDEGRLPYNTTLLLSLEILKQLTPLLLPEIMFGLAGTEGENILILNLSLSKNKIEELKEQLSIINGEVELIHK